MPKAKCKCPKPGLTAPFYMLTYGDMMTLLLTFFVLLFSMSTIQSSKFQAQISIMQGSLGISKLYQHAPMQKHLPAPAIKQYTKVIAKSEVKRPSDHSASESSSVTNRSASQHGDDAYIKAIRALGTEDKMQTYQFEEEVVIILPTFGLFSKGEWQIDPSSPEVKRVAKLYKQLAEQLSFITKYDIYFVGHTDSIPVTPHPEGPKNNMELGFLRAIGIYDCFFSHDLSDKTRISFASQGDNVPLISQASLDSERQKNRRVEIRLKKRI